MATATYEEVLQGAKHLTLEERRRLIGELSSTLVTDALDETVEAPNDESLPLPDGRQRSILELRGFGKELWEGIDSTEYLNAERSAWDR